MLARHLLPGKKVPCDDFRFCPARRRQPRPKMGFAAPTGRHSLGERETAAMQSSFDDWFERIADRKRLEWQGLERRLQ
jgi:hypothetical protein